MPSATSLHPLAARRAAHLRHGINLSHRHSQVHVKEGCTPEHFDRYNTASNDAGDFAGEPMRGGQCEPAEELLAAPGLR